MTWLTLRRHGRSRARSTDGAETAGAPTPGTEALGVVIGAQRAGAVFGDVPATGPPTAAPQAVTLCDPLPSAAEEKQARRPLWRRPVVIVSAAVALVVAGGVGGWTAWQALRPRAVESLALTSTDQVVTLTWTGPDVAYQVLALVPGSEPVDRSLSVRSTGTGWGAWMARSGAQRSCFLVRIEDDAQDGASAGADLPADPAAAAASGSGAVCETGVTWAEATGG